VGVPILAWLLRLSPPNPSEPSGTLRTPPNPPLGNVISEPSRTLRAPNAPPNASERDKVYSPHSSWFTGTKLTDETSFAVWSHWDNEVALSEPACLCEAPLRIISDSLVGASNCEQLFPAL
jgi:hypothetical protein